MTSSAQNDDGGRGEGGGGGGGGGSVRLDISGESIASSVCSENSPPFVGARSLKKSFPARDYHSSSEGEVGGRG